LDTGIACPQDAIQTRGVVDAVDRVVAEVKRLGVACVVVGHPLRMDGTEGEAARRARRFADAVGRKSGVDVILWDERLSTAMASRVLREAGVRGERRKQAVDSMAAALILQSYLDAQRGEHGAAADF
jgi:putative Holliday junction resolvase